MPMQPIAAFLLITLPWLNPFSMGPSPGVVPLMFSWACAGALLLVCWRIPNRVSGERLVSAIAAAWLVAALLSSLMGLLQYFGATAPLGFWVNSTGLGEAYANLRQRNQFATLTNIGLAALLWSVAQGRNSSSIFRKTSTASVLALRSLLPLMAAVLLGLGNAASSSRTGLMQLVLLVVMAGVWRLVRGRTSEANRVLGAAVLAYAVAALALPLVAGLDPNASGILARLHDGGAHCSSRLTLWGNVLQLIAQKPWLGWGWGELDFAHFVNLYPGERFCEILDNAHNLPLHLAVELGLPLALLVCGGGLWLAWRAQPWRELDATRQLAWTVLAVILLHSLLEYPLWYGPFQMAFALSVWLLWRAPNDLATKFKPFSLLALVLPALIATLLIAFSGYAAWDYDRISQIYKAPAQRSDALRDNTLAKIADSRLFADQVRFAELTTTALTLGNAEHIHALALALLHFSPEPRVVEKLIESAVLLGRDDEALYYDIRYQAAFPESHEKWAQDNPM
ncbi:MAG: Wzy polymerase domain-containing protein [Rhodoferax sp.]|uniref:PglL family O-oligosaccharyltransferase n=1 Tax=Rhodoferax sp. TaxID=50421 RepID=UPI003016DE5F